MQKYRYKNIIVAAQQYHKGLEDGYVDTKTNRIYQYSQNRYCKPVVFVDSYMGKIPTIVKLGDYIVIRKGKKLVFSANWFEKHYSKELRK